MAGKLRRWLGEVAIFLALLIAVMVIMDVWRAPQVPPAFAATPLRTLTEESTTLAALSEKRPYCSIFGQAGAGCAVLLRLRSLAWRQRGKTS
ncbi:alkyl hydroperoxide reductase [Salmonella enterica subsp. arizonae]|uniref:Alkyl hydroperoxide reductase n=1 Tax=Salmonella enterica subsp. arizonae TaxID=59203 RepID=A0A379SWL2_SALER|nr:alkyl hydroperoxide reductase [Salmonella enterica subsp. arizonae]